MNEAIHNPASVSLGLSPPNPNNTNLRRAGKRWRAARCPRRTNGLGRSVRISKLAGTKANDWMQDHGSSSTSSLRRPQSSTALSQTGHRAQRRTSPTIHPLQNKCPQAVAVGCSQGSLLHIRQWNGERRVFWIGGDGERDNGGVVDVRGRGPATRGGEGERLARLGDGVGVVGVVFSSVSSTSCESASMTSRGNRETRAGSGDGDGVG